MILFTADLHLSDNPRDMYRDQWMEKLPALARKLKCSTAVIGGDLTEEKDRHAAWLTNRVCEHIRNLAKVCRVIVYPGNHDYIEEGNPFFAFIGGFEGVTFYSRPHQTNVEGVGQCLFLPHTRDYKRDWDGVLNTRCAHIFAHNSFAGADLGNGRLSTGIPTSIFGKGQEVFAGDVHIPQKVGPVRYVGAPYTVDFGDDYAPRLLTIDWDKVKSVPCVGPQKLLITLGLRDPIDALDKYETIKGDVVKVRVHVKKFEQEPWSAVVDAVRSWAAERSINLHAVQPVVADAEGTRVMRKDVVKRVDDKQTVHQFGKTRGVDDRTLETGYFIMDRSK